MTRLRMLVTVLAGAGLLIGFATPATAQEPYPPGTNEECVQTDDDSYAPGDSIVIFGFTPTVERRCFDPDTLVTITLESEPVVLAVARTDHFGDYATDTTIPRDTAPGPHTIRASGVLNGIATDYTTTIQITAAAPVARLPRTGTDLLILAGWALGLLVLGSILISATWRRWRAAREEAASMADRFAPSFLDGDVADVVPHRELPTQSAEVVDVEEVPEPLPVLEVEIEDAELVEEIEEPAAELVEEIEEPAAQPVWASNGSGDVDREPVSVGAESAPASVRESARNGAARTSDVVARLQEEIAAWNKR